MAGGDCVFLAFLFSFCWKPDNFCALETSNWAWRRLETTVLHNSDPAFVRPEWMKEHSTAALHLNCSFVPAYRLKSGRSSHKSRCNKLSFLHAFSLRTDQQNPGIALNKYSRSRTSSERLLHTGGHADWDYAHGRTTSDAPFLWFQRPFPKVPVSVTYYFCLVMFVVFNWEWEQNVIKQKVLHGGWGGNHPLHICRALPWWTVSP